MNKFDIQSYFEFSLDDEHEFKVYNYDGFVDAFYKRNVSGLLHCEDGVALVWAEAKDHVSINPFKNPQDVVVIRQEWWINGQQHREDGPAIRVVSSPEYTSPNNTTVPSIYDEWYLHGNRYHNEDFPKYMVDAGWSDEKIVQWKLTNKL